MVKLKKLRPRCFFDISIDKKNVGRIIFELFNEICPKTCENFKALCTGEKGIGKLTKKPLHYKNVSFHRIVKNFIIQSGDFSRGNGKGGESIYGGTFEDETFHFKHDKPFLLSMANRGKNTNGSQFFITLASLPHLDGTHVVFGHVISGHDVVLQIANQTVDKHSRPIVDVSIANCGELIPQIKPKEKSTSKIKKRHRHRKRFNSESESESESDSSSDSDNESDSDDSSEDSSSSEDSESSSSSGTSSTSSEKSEKRKKKKEKSDEKDQKIHNDVKKDEEKNSNVENENNFPFFNPKYSVKINPEEIPEIPKNKFLTRNIPKNKAIEKDTEMSFVRKFSYTKSGRKIKGRGYVRYRTPSKRERYRRSETPQHWREEQSKLRPFKKVLANNNNEMEEDKSDSRPMENRRCRSRSRSKEGNFKKDRHDYRSRRHSRSSSLDRKRNDRKEYYDLMNDKKERRKERMPSNGHVGHTKENHESKYEMKTKYPRSPSWEKSKRSADSSAHENRKSRKT